MLTTLVTRAAAQAGRLCVLLAAAGVNACGGGSPTIGGSLVGLDSGQSITVQNNGSSTLTLTSNGAWAFPQAATDGTYSVTILTQPTGQVCSLSNATGTYTAGASSVTSIQIDCGSSTAITGTVSGLLSSNTVELYDGNARLTISANGSFSFPDTLAAGTVYTVTVLIQPTQGNCLVSNGTGTIANNVATNVVVNCS